LKSNPVEQLQGLCQFAGLKRTNESLQSVVKACSFESMREKEKDMGWNSTIWPKDKPFVRRGAVGSFKDEMPRAISAEFIRQAGHTLVRAGYSAD
jgi:hypothetical protein